MIDVATAKRQEMKANGSNKRSGGYTVSQDQKTGLWYCHMRGFAYIPCFGSFCEKKSDAMEYAKMYNGLPHRVEKIEKEKGMCRNENISL